MRALPRCAAVLGMWLELTGPTVAWADQFLLVDHSYTHQASDGSHYYGATVVSHPPNWTSSLVSPGGIYVPPPVDGGTPSAPPDGGVDGGATPDASTGGTGDSGVPDEPDAGFNASDGGGCTQTAVGGPCYLALLLLLGC